MEEEIIAEKVRDTIVDHITTSLQAISINGHCEAIVTMIEKRYAGIRQIEATVRDREKEMMELSEAIRLLPNGGSHLRDISNRIKDELVALTAEREKGIEEYNKAREAFLSIEVISPTIDHLPELVK